MKKGYLSEHIKKSEVACKCGCGASDISPDILMKAEFARTAMNIRYAATDELLNKQERGQLELTGEIKLHISSACRCPEHNAKPVSKGGAGGSKNSQHITTNLLPCRAIDGWFYWGTSIENRLDAEEVLVRMFQDRLINGLGLYDKYRFHIDCRVNGRWFKDYRKGSDNK